MEDPGPIDYDFTGNCSEFFERIYFGTQGRREAKLWIFP